MDISISLLLCLVAGMCLNRMFGILGHCKFSSCKGMVSIVWLVRLRNGLMGTRILIYRLMRSENPRYYKIDTHIIHPSLLLSRSQMDTIWRKIVQIWLDWLDMFYKLHLEDIIFQNSSFLTVPFNQNYPQQTNLFDFKFVFQHQGQPH